ncbi:TerD family protein [Dactylosporangium fulvum]|uniref:TerD family protein n=1 Tax=Dactylosporangium fulvum TaxID=53359 RepID=A0ABY5VTC1_9ACTN|nr:TerD family protein [Dactylosporangium fulvum]UWP80361.1 TerD family protein [Dactylosporangium fulvum]
MRRGANVGLTREIPGLRGVVIGVRFVAGAERTLADNLVVAAILCDATTKALSDRHFVFFNQLTSSDLSVRQLEQVLGADSEQIEVDLDRVPPEVSRIVVVLYINEGAVQRRSLGQLRSCSVRVLNLDDNVELVRSEDLAAGLTQETGLALGELYRHNREWKFKVLGDAYAGGIAQIAADYGVPL